MDQRIRKRSLAIIISLTLLTNLKVSGCWYGESSEIVRIAMFKAELGYMQAYRPLYYSAQILNSLRPDPAHSDWQRNCREWQAQLGNSVSVNDIMVILYKTEPSLFFNTLDNNELHQVFEGNTFISALLKKGNENYLKYLILAKKAEYSNFASGNPWDEWPGLLTYNRDHHRFGLLDSIQACLETCTNPFLQQRYAFQVVRLCYQVSDYFGCISYYDRFFGKDSPGNSVVKTWAMLHKAHALDHEGLTVEANYLYSKVFSDCDEKKIRALQFFNTDADMIKKTLALCKNSPEKATVFALEAFKNPGPALDLIQEVYHLQKNSDHLAPLVMREINKLEDWIWTGLLTSNRVPAVYYKEIPDWYEYSQQGTILKNRESNRKYLKEFLAYLISIEPDATGSLRNYIDLAIAHLQFMDNNIQDGERYLSLVPWNAPESLLIQKTIDNLLVSLTTKTLRDEQTKNQVARDLELLEKKACKNTELNKSLYSLLKKTSHVLVNQDKVVAGLLFLKSEIAKAKYSQLPEKNNLENLNNLINTYYHKIGWFDRYASADDVQRLIGMIKKENKTSFEEYLCRQPLPELNALYDLQGTMYFRTGNLTGAWQVFQLIPDAFWGKNFEFKKYLNEDPFTPKCFVLKRDFSFVFNKKELTSQLLKLQKEAEAKPERKGSNYLKMAHAYYNSSYWGTAWMMMSYSWSSGDPFYDNSPYEEIFFYQPDYIKSYAENYYHCKLAETFYKKAQASTADKEIKAEAQLMVHQCEKNRYMFDCERMKQQAGYSDSVVLPAFSSASLDGFFRLYNNTKAFDYHYNRCSELEDYAISNRMIDPETGKLRFIP